MHTFIVIIYSDLRQVYLPPGADFHCGLAELRPEESLSLTSLALEPAEC